MKTKHKPISRREIIQYIIVFIAVGSSLLYLSHYFWNNPTPISGYDSKTYTEEEAINMYNNTREKFKSVAEIILSNDSFFQNVYYREDTEGATSSAGAVIFPDDFMKKYFSQEDWDKISEFFVNTGPDYIVRYEDSVIAIFYGHISFYYFGGDKVDLNYYGRFQSSFTQIEGNWYLGGENE
jgi:hypothetical protein